MAAKKNPHKCACEHANVRYCMDCKLVHCLDCKMEWASVPCTREHYTGTPWRSYLTTSPSLSGGTFTVPMNVGVGVGGMANSVDCTHAGDA